MQDSACPCIKEKQVRVPDLGSWPSRRLPELVQPAARACAVEVGQHRDVMTQRTAWWKL